jgi:glutamate racemase
VRFPDRKILGVTIPGAEKVIEVWYRKIGVLATESSVKSKAYKERVHFHDDTVSVQEIAAPDIVPLIEQWRFDDPETIQYIENYLGSFDPDIEALVLGCTHYPIIRHHIEQILPDLPIIDPGRESALKFRDYLIHHPEIEKNLSREWEVKFFTSGDPEVFRRIGENIINQKIKQIYQP